MNLGSTGGGERAGKEPCLYTVASGTPRLYHVRQIFYAMRCDSRWPVPGQSRRKLGWLHAGPWLTVCSASCTACFTSVHRARTMRARTVLSVPVATPLCTSQQSQLQGRLIHTNLQKRLWPTWPAGSRINQYTINTQS
jgi:hypothetical protein